LDSHIAINGTMLSHAAPADVVPVFHTLVDFLHSTWHACLAEPRLLTRRNSVYALGARRAAQQRVKSKANDTMTMRTLDARHRCGIESKTVLQGCRVCREFCLVLVRG
jgi:hypothetical protein